MEGDCEEEEEDGVTGGPVGEDDVELAEGLHIDERQQRERESLRWRITDIRSEKGFEIQRLEGELEKWKGTCPLC